MLKEVTSKEWIALDPLFAARAAGIMREGGEGHLLMEEAGMQDLWRSFTSRNAVITRKGAKANLNRFMSLVHLSRKFKTSWTMRRLLFEWVLLEQGQLKDDVAKAGSIKDPAADGDKSTAAKTESKQDPTLIHQLPIEHQQQQLF